MNKWILTLCLLSLSIESKTPHLMLLSSYKDQNIEG